MVIFCNHGNLPCGAPSRRYGYLQTANPSLTSRTNRIIGGNAPKKYMESIVKNHHISTDALKQHLEAHLVDPDLLEQNNFNGFIVDRAKKLLDLIQKAIGKSVTGRDSEEVIREFGAPLN